MVGVDEAVIVIEDHRALGAIDTDGAVAAVVDLESAVEVPEQQPREIVQRLVKRDIVAWLLAPVEGKADGLIDDDRLLLRVERAISPIWPLSPSPSYAMVTVAMPRSRSALGWRAWRRRCRS